jgi:hypothetical protein
VQSVAETTMMVAVFSLKTEKLNNSQNPSISATYRSRQLPSTSTPSELPESTTNASKNNLMESQKYPELKWISALPPTQNLTIMTAIFTNKN